MRALSYTPCCHTRGNLEVQGPLKARQGHEYSLVITPQFH